MPALYQLAVLGEPSEEQLASVRACVSDAVGAFGLSIGTDVEWNVRPASFTPVQARTAAAVYFGHTNPAADGNLEHLRDRAIPLLPVVSNLQRVSDEIPESLRPFNCLDYGDGGAQRVATALLECCGLLRPQRRLFLSYKRTEARAAALQLFDEFSARVFDVFLDTHGVPPAADFQSVLWHRLCDSDVLVMLDTPSYFESRWTAAEFGRALAKDIAVLRVGWPNATACPRAATASRVDLAVEELDDASGRLEASAIRRICTQVEAVRSEGYAVRTVNLVSNLRIAIEKIGGRVLGIGLHKGVHLELPDGGRVTVYPTIGVPTAVTLHDAALNCANNSAAVVYDPVGRATWEGSLSCLAPRGHLVC